MSLQLETTDTLDKNTTVPVPQLATWHRVTWTSALVLRLSAVSVLTLLTLLGNMIVITTITSCAELRKKRVNIFILNLAVGDLMVCFLSMPLNVALAVVGQWMLGNVGCKLVIYGYIVAVLFTVFMLTTMSIDRYQVCVTRKPCYHRENRAMPLWISICIVFYKGIVGHGFLGLHDTVLIHHSPLYFLVLFLLSL